MEHDDIKLKIVDINDGEALIEAARPKGKPLTEKQKQALIQAQKKKEEEKKEIGRFAFHSGGMEKDAQKCKKEPLKVHGIFGRPRITDDGLYQIRTRAHGLNIQVTHKDFTVCKELYIEALENALEGKETPKKKAPVCFVEYMCKWLETVKKPSVKAVTYADYRQTFTAYISPAFPERKIKDISRQELQEFINGYSEKGNNRTAKKIYQLLKSAFDYAVDDELISKNPMERVILPKYEQEHGRALTRAEEKEFIEKAKKDALFRSIGISSLYGLAAFGAFQRNN